jgi:hypothetical protein
MNKHMLLFMSFILLASCEKTDDFLTNGTWVLTNDNNIASKESVKFYSDGTYLVESQSSVYSLAFTFSGSVTGNWKKLDNDITFLNAKIKLNNDYYTEIELAITSGYSIVDFYHLTRFSQSDSIPVSSPNSILNAWRPIHLGLDKANVWHIISITKELLTVTNNSETEIYKKE